MYENQLKLFFHRMKAWCENFVESKQFVAINNFVLVLCFVEFTGFIGSLTIFAKITVETRGEPTSAEEADIFSFVLAENRCRFLANRQILNNISTNN